MFPLKVLLSKLGLIFIECGYSRYCIDYIVNGFAGLRISENGVSLNPYLPKGWTGYSFKFRYKGSLVQVTVGKKGTEVKTIEGPEVKVLMGE